MAAGLLRADPADGFGPGAPAGKAAHVSWHGAGHLVSGSVGFTALIVACFVIARYFAIYSRITGLAFLAAFAGVTTGSSSSGIVVPFYAGVLIAWIWIAIISVHLYRRASGPSSL
jgi:small-conductance mechanosensitive channel